LSAEVEIDFLKHLFDLDSMEVIAWEGVDPDVLPTSDIREIYVYALDYFFQSGKTRAITEMALRSYEISVGRSMMEMLDDLEIVIDDPDLEINDVIMKLKGQFIQKEISGFNKSLAILMADAPIMERLAVASKSAIELITLVSKLESKRVRVGSTDGVRDQLVAYNERSKSKESSQGMSLGLKQVDDHILMVHPGEIAVFAGFAKSGKSLMSIISALSEHKRGKRVVLFSLENSIQMTMDRIITTATSVDSERFQRGNLDEGEKKRVVDWIEMHATSGNPIQVIQPESGHRSVRYMLQQAQVHDAESVIIDQLSHIEHPRPARKPRNEVVHDIMQDLHLVASTALVPLPVLLFHQINREGKKYADKTGYYSMLDLAESSEVERSASFVFSLYQSRDAAMVGRALLQMLASRRTSLKNWQMMWQPAFGHGSVLHEQEIHG
jgi:hypothetical protein